MNLTNQRLNSENQENGGKRNEIEKYEERIKKIIQPRKEEWMSSEN